MDESLKKMLGLFIIGESYHRVGRDDLAKPYFDEALGESDIFETMLRLEEDSTSSFHDDAE